MPLSKIRRVFELRTEFFDLAPQLKTSAAVIPCPGGGLSRGYQCLGAGAAETFVVGPPLDAQRPMRWPVGVRGDVLKVTLQGFFRSCLRLHDDLLSIIEVALHLRDDELAARWARQNGEVRLWHCHRPNGPRPKDAPRQADGNAGGEESGNGKALLTLGFQETEPGEVALLCGPTLSKWLRGRSRRGNRHDSGGAADGHDDEDQSHKDCQRQPPSQFPLSFTGYEDVDVAHGMNGVS